MFPYRADAGFKYCTPLGAIDLLLMSRKDGKKEERIVEKEEAECHLPWRPRLLLASSGKRKRVLQPLSYFKLQFSVEDGGEKGDTKTVTRHVQLLCEAEHEQFPSAAKIFLLTIVCTRHDYCLWFRASGYRGFHLLQSFLYL